MKPRIDMQGMRTFTIIWLGQLVSLTGSGLTGFALGVWVFQRTGSVTQFALIALFTILPGLPLSPIAGALVDRWSRRWVMMLSDAGSGISTLAIALLFVTGKLEIWHIYVATAASSACSAFQWPAYAASVAMLVPKRQLGRANGMVQVSQAVSQAGSPGARRSAGRDDTVGRRDTDRLRNLPFRGRHTDYLPYPQPQNRRGNQIREKLSIARGDTGLELSRGAAWALRHNSALRRQQPHARHCQRAGDPAGALYRVS